MSIAERTDTSPPADPPRRIGLLRSIGIGLAAMVAAMVAVLVACELLLRLLPVSTSTDTGYRLDPAILNYPPHHAWTMSTGWDLRNPQRMTADNLGFAADHDAVADPNAVPLIGDSYVEASMLDAPDRPAAQLERQLGRPVNAMGGPGSALLDYAERIRWAAAHLAARDIVILMERSDVRQSLCGSGNVHAACLDPATLEPRMQPLPAPGPMKRLLRRSALAQYVVSQLKLDPAGLYGRALLQAVPVAASAPAPDPAPATGPSLGSAPAPHDPTVPIASPTARPTTALSAREAQVIDAVTERFFERIQDARPAHLVIVLDSDRVRLEQHLAIDDPGRRRFMALARAHGAVVIDTEPLFAAHFAGSARSLRVGPYDSHPNRLANHISMTAAGAALDAARRTPAN